MGHATEVWNRLSAMMQEADLDDIPEIYTADALYLEPYNPPHRGNLLIQAYLKDYYAGKDDIAVEDRQLIESADGRRLAVEWAISYTAAGRRWNDLPRGSFLTFDADGLVVYHRDYT